MYVYVYLFIYIYIYIYIGCWYEQTTGRLFDAPGHDCMYIHLHIYKYSYKHMHTHIHIGCWRDIHVFLFIYVYIHTCICLYIYTHIHIYQGCRRARTSGRLLDTSGHDLMARCHWRSTSAAVLRSDKEDADKGAHQKMSRDYVATECSLDHRCEFWKVSPQLYLICRISIKQLSRISSLNLRHC